MTTRDDLDRVPPEFDRLMTGWFEAEARVHEPIDLLDRTTARTRAIRPRPAWLLPERWIPMELTMRRVRTPRFTRYAVLLAVLILLAAVALAIVGSQRRVPAPFGPARNGVITYATPTGDIATVDPATGIVDTIVGGLEKDRAPTFSRDGTRIAFIREVIGGDEVYAVDVSDHKLVRLTSKPMATLGFPIWSPDGSKVAMTSLDRLWIVNTNGTGASMVDTGDIDAGVELAWRPPDGRELILMGLRGGKADLYLVRLDGSRPTRITSLDSGDQGFQWVTPSPDGRRVAFGMFPEKDVHIVTIDGGADLVVSHPAGVGLNFPRWSPDGKRVALLQVSDTGPTRIGVVSADDPSGTLTLTGPQFSGGVQYDWSPDGKTVLAVAWDTDQPWILDPAGGEGTKPSWHAALPDFVEWQRLAQ